MTFYDLFVPEAEAPAAAATEPRYRLEVVLDSRGRLASV